MICAEMFSVTGLACTPMDDEGLISLIETPFRFPDGDAFQIFAEDDGTTVRFFDEGGTLQHLAGRGVAVGDARKLRFLKQIEHEHHVKLTERGELEILAQRSDASDAFRHYLEALLAVARWESEHQGVDMDIAQLLDEVAVVLAWNYPNERIQREVMMTGVSKQQQRIDFVVGNRAIFAIKPQHNAVASAIRKVLDVRNTEAGCKLEFEVILDDRQHPDAARNEGQVIATVAAVSNLSPLLQRKENRAPLH